MGMSADFAVHTNNGKGEDPVSKLDAAFIRAMTDETAGVTFGRGGFCFLNFMVTKPYDNTRGLRIKQFDGKYIRFLYSKTSFITP